MVRVVSQSFNHPRSRHSSGETDLDLALRADSALALSTQRGKRTEFVDYESSSDSFWDSEFDAEQQDHVLLQNGNIEGDINGNGAPVKSDVHVKRKERRRERNKVSAQAYRQRRRQVNVSTIQELTVLEERNKKLLQQVHDLEEKTEQAKQFLKGQRVVVPDFLIPSSNSVNMNNGQFSPISFSNHSDDLYAAATTPNSDENISCPHPSLKPNRNVNGNLNSPNVVFGTVPENNSHLANGIPPNTNMNANSNLPKISSINLNAQTAPSSPVSDAFLSSPSNSPAVRPKQNAFINANHYYRVPIHHPKALRTVHEIPPNFSNTEEEPNTLTLDNKPDFLCDSSKLKSEVPKAILNDLGTNANMELLNINMNERVHRNFCNNKDDQIWNGAYQLNLLKNVEMNDNDNLPSSKPRLQNNHQKLLLQQNIVQLIIASGDNSKLPPQ